MKAFCCKSSYLGFAHFAMYICCGLHTVDSIPSRCNQNESRLVASPYLMWSVVSMSTAAAPYTDSALDLLMVHLESLFD